MESEIKYWEFSKFNKVYILPCSNKGKRRALPQNIEVINVNIQRSFFIKILAVLKALLSNILFNDIKYLIKKRKISLSSFSALIRTASNTIRQKNNIAKAIEEINGDVFVYSYWNDVAAYAACLLKRENKIKYVVSRAHRFDLYENHRGNNYMPVKRQFVEDFDKVYLLNEAAKSYYAGTYGAPKHALDVARLGVSTLDFNSSYQFYGNCLRVLSLSFCVPVKRLDKIVSALHVYAEMNPDIYVYWKHIGGGPLYQALRREAEDIEKKYSNFKVDFVGQLTNIEVKKTLEESVFDLLINSSDSEGVPVSIMEAMSFGIPAVAPDVGGISDLVCSSTGFLLPAHPSVDDIIEGLKSVHDENNIFKLRKNSIRKVSENFNSDKNYPEFVTEIENLAT